MSGEVRKAAYGLSPTERSGVGAPRSGAMLRNSITVRKAGEDAGHGSGRLDRPLYGAGFGQPVVRFFWRYAGFTGRASLRVFASVVSVGLLVGLLAGCGSEERKAEQAMEQQAQLDAYITKADSWGEEIFAQIPQAEVEDAVPGNGGVSKASAHYAEWPKYYVWSEHVDLKPDGPRTPSKLADDLEPWLESQGWVRNQKREMSPGKKSFTRYYFREHYTLMVDVYTTAPPKAQNIFFTIVSPDTRPSK